MGGYYTLSAMAVNAGEWPEATVRKLPRHPLIPATFLGRLAVERRHRGRGYGRFLLAEALTLAEPACCLVLRVDDDREGVGISGSRRRLENNHLQT